MDKNCFHKSFFFFFLFFLSSFSFFFLTFFFFSLIIIRPGRNAHSEWSLITEIKADEAALFAAAFTRRVKQKRRAFQKNPRTAFRSFATLFSRSRVVGDHLTLPTREPARQTSVTRPETSFFYSEVFASGYTVPFTNHQTLAQNYGEGET